MIEQKSEPKGEALVETVAVLPQRLVEVSVILPTKNEEGTIGICIDKIQRVFDAENIYGEIIVSDSSKDNTANIAESLGAVVIRPDRRGYGYAYRYAFKHARGKYIVIGDADDTYDFAELPKLLKPLKRGVADLVIGSRFKGKIEKGAMRWHHKWIGNPLLTRFLNRFFNTDLSDSHSGFRAIKKEALEKLDLRTDGMEFASEMIIEATAKGLRMKEIPINYYRRKNGDSKLASFSDGWRHLKYMLILTPNYLFIYPGLFFAFTGLFLMISAFLNVYVVYTAGIHSLITGSILLILGHQVILFGIFSKVLQRKSLFHLLTLERGATVGSLIFLAGSMWVTKIVLEWVNSGFTILPPVEHSIICLTLIVLGLQTFFSSFMLSVIADQRQRWAS